MSSEPPAVPAQDATPENPPPRDEPQNQNDQDQPQPASPPLPAPHTAVTPGPRAARLQELFVRSLENTLEKISWENLAACYPTIARSSPALLKGVRKQMVEKLEGMCKREFDRILDERAVVPKLNELESLISEAIRRRESAPPDSQPPTPPHLLPANTVLQAHLSAPLAASTAQLAARLEATRSDNEALFGEVTAQRAQIEELVALLERTVADVDAANELLSTVVDEVAKEAREREVEMMGS